MMKFRPSDTEKLALHKKRQTLLLSRAPKKTQKKIIKCHLNKATDINETLLNKYVWENLINENFFRSI